MLIVFATACGGGTTAPAGSGSGATDGNSNSNSGGSSNSDVQEPPATDEGSKLSGTPVEILSALVQTLKADGVEMPMSLEPMDVTSDLAHNTLGLTTDEFDRLVVSAANSLAAIGTFAHQIVLIEANDVRAAGEVKRIISSNGGYDPQKWVCVWPERCVVVDSGDYVLLVASYNEVVDAAIAIFKDMAGTVGTVVTFWEFTGEQSNVEGGLGGAALLPEVVA